MSEELAYASATELLKGYASGDISPVDATQAALDQIRRYDGALNAFVFVDEEGALAAAKQSEDRWKNNAPQGMIDGIPTTIKDIMLMKGFPTLKGSCIVDPAGPWDDDAPAVQRLREQGAVLLGKTTTPEFGWKGVTDSPLSGATRNPWNPAMTPGGSSGGASAACAAGMGVLHTGSDGGGSIRIPAAFTGIFGLKPSFGRVPVWPASAFGTVSHVGPMTRSVADAALMLQSMIGFDYRDWFSLPATDVDYRTSLKDGFKGRKVAYSRNLGYAAVNDDVARAVDKAVDLIRASGVDVVEVDPGFENPIEMFKTLWYSGAAYAMKDVPEDKRDMLDPGLKQVIEEAAGYGINDVMDASVARTELGIKMRKFHQQYDLLLTPSLSVTAFPVSQLTPDDRQVGGQWVDWTPFSYPFNLTQQPACSVPCGFGDDGMPVGLQIVGPMHRDDMVLAAAAAFEEMSPVRGARPDLSKLV
ncbi:amidase [Sneathiella sp.]|jgi:aspartyl-tRNA(Asn)/glutamyl-tRNA(Gln) amidotransferase subunit A|uniref:amidase n=1 Tax=Sneathiella sp. TaxID=1964365 RepID=UPI0039E2BFA2